MEKTDINLAQHQVQLLLKQESKKMIKDKNDITKINVALTSYELLFCPASDSASHCGAGVVGRGCSS